jgi:hypothetical protein
MAGFGVGCSCSVQHCECSIVGKTNLNPGQQQQHLMEWQWS